ncbi:MAG TPA: hypothetical protein IAC46_00100 [Candidatus Onthoplasma faecigallinarum]|mgnify:FL=1|nr:hypothetical protein [Candidatus Onthoplasma faecigallinarum]
MKIYDFVQLINSLEYLEEKGIFKESKGTIIKLENNIASVLFFNEKNMGDYAVANVNTKFLKTIGEFPTGELTNLNNFIKNLDQEKHDKLKYPNIKEYDLVELLIEDEKYSKFGVHKGNKGCVISNYAIQNQVEVDFSWVDKNGNFYGDCIVVDVDDLKVLE